MSKSPMLCTAGAKRVAVVLAPAVLAVSVLGTAYVQAAHPAPSSNVGKRQAAPPPATPAMAAEQQRALLNQYCVTCHSERLKTGGLTLEKLDTAHVGDKAATWEKVVRKLRSGTMPPTGRPRPDKVTVESFITSLEGNLDRAAAASPDPGRPAIHRLNRVEYVNAIRDLLSLDIDGRSLLPGDDSGFGFDNIADVLTMSPGLLDRYLAVSRKVAKLAIGDAAVKRTVETVVRLPIMLLQDDRMSSELPFGSRGGAVVRHTFPLDGTYIVKVHLQRGTMSGTVRGRTEDNQVDVRVDGTRVKLVMVPKTEVTPADYEKADTSGPVEVPLSLKAGPHSIAIAFVKGTTMVEGWGPTRFPAGSTSFASTDRTSNDGGVINMGLDRVDVEGPIDGLSPDDTPARRAIFVCRPTGPQDEEACARRILSRLSYYAYHRPVTDRDVQTLMTFYKSGRAEGSFDKGIQFALERLLVDPAFLFRVEGGRADIKPGAVEPLNDFELASRLSFFLWSSIPDDELLAAASKGRLRDPLVLERQIRRMLADNRSNALVDNFFGQWLYTRNLSQVTPDPTVYPEFDDNLRAAFQQETSLFLQSQVREDRSVLDLLTANYTFVNERLARHYGIPNVYGSHFRRVALPDEKRSGLLGQGSVLTVTALANRTSPVYRGKWLMQNILGTPPPPPPANVPPLDDTKVEGTLRQRMEAHRKNPVCATCHSQIDPLGFALENFDGIGKYREMDGKSPIDPSGTLPDGTKFDGPVAFRKVLLERRAAYIDTVTEKMMTYALGRGVEPSDMPAVRSVLREAAGKEYRWSAIIMGIVKSMPFQMRRAES